MGVERLAVSDAVRVTEAEPFEFLTAWFAEHCDGDWEHDEGIRLETLDNPGWALDVRTEDTELQGRVIDWVKDDQSEEEWLYWRSTGTKFEVRCGVMDLPRAVQAFQDFAHQPI